MLKICFALLAFLLMDCKTNHKEVIWEPDLYKANPKTKSIIKYDGESKREIKCSSREFKKYVCMASDDIARIYDLCLKAK